MIEKIEITQRFNFKRLNRHYECFTIDLVNRNAYYKISERGSGDKVLDESSLCDDTWIDMLVGLRRNMTSEIRRFTAEQACQFLSDFEDLKLFEDFESERFLYFSKLELIYSCIVIIYSTDGYAEYSFKNNFPKNWVGFGEILKDLFGFDVLHLDYQRHLATPLFYDIRPDGVYSDGENLDVKTIEFGHYRTYPYDLPHPRLIINFDERRIDGYIQKEMLDDGASTILNLFKKYHVYAWILREYHRKSLARDPDDLEGYDWYLEIVFKGDVIWHLFGYNDYPDTYVHLGREIERITQMDLCEISTISDEDVKLFDRFGDDILG